MATKHKCPKCGSKAHRCRERGVVCLHCDNPNCLHGWQKWKK